MFFRTFAAKSEGNLMSVVARCFSTYHQTAKLKTENWQLKTENCQLKTDNFFVALHKWKRHQ